MTRGPADRRLPARNAARSGARRRRAGGRAVERHLPARAGRDRRSARAQPRDGRARSKSSSRSPRRACAAPGWSGRAAPVRIAARASRCRFRSAISAPTCATLAATVAGNLYDLGEATGLQADVAVAAAGLSRALRAAAPGHRRNARARRRARPSAARHHHQAECRHERGADRRAGRRALRRRARLHQGRRGLRRSRDGADRRAHPRRDGARARASGPHRPARDGGVQHLRRDRRDAPPRRPDRRAKAAPA